MQPSYLLEMVLTPKGKETGNTTAFYGPFATWDLAVDHGTRILHDYQHLKIVSGFYIHLMNIPL